MDKEKHSGRIFWIILAIVAVLAGVLVLLYRLDKRVQRLYYRLEHKMTPHKNTPFEVEL